MRALESERTACPPSMPDELDSRNARLRPAALALLTGLLFYLLWNSLYFSPFLVDDTFISFRYARMLVSGEGLVFNPGERVEGFSNFLWVMVEAVILLLGLPIVTATKMVACASGIATGLLTFRLGQRIFRGPGAMPWVFLACAGVCFNTSLAVWMQSGLETAFFGMLVIASCLQFERERDGHQRLPLSGLLFAAAWMTRPEAPAYALYFVVRRLCALRTEPFGRRDLIWVLSIAAVVVPYEAWGLLYYGHLFPNTHVAKVESNDASLLAKFINQLPRFQLYNFVVHQGWAWMGLLGLGLAGCARRIRSLPPACWAPLVSGGVFLIYAWSDWMPRFRFCVPTLPFLFLALAYGIWQLESSLRTSPRLRIAVMTAAVVLFAGYAQNQMFGAYYKSRDRGNFNLAGEARGFWFLDVPEQVRSDRLFPLESLTWQLLTELREGETAAVRDIGLPGYLTMNPLWDARGLVTPAMARGRSGDPELMESVIDEILEVRPILIRLGSGSTKQHAPALNDALRNSKRIAEVYTQVHLKLGGAEYRLRDWTQPDSDARIRAALEAFPEYAREGTFAREYSD